MSGRILVGIYKSYYSHTLTLCKVRSHPLLKNNTNDTTANNNPSPWVRQLSQTRPEAVLLGPPGLQLLVFVGVLELVARLLACFVLLVAADEAQVEVVCERAQEDEGIEIVGGVEDDEREVDEGVPEVARFVSFCRKDDLGIGWWLTLDAARYSTHHGGRDQTVPDDAVPAAYRQEPPLRNQR